MLGRKGKHVASTSRRISRGWITPLAVVLSLVMGTVAWADEIVNTIDTSPDAALETVTITAGGSVQVGFSVTASNTVPAEDASGCNATGSDPAYMSVSAPAGVSITYPTLDVGQPANTLKFVGCGNEKKVTLSSSSVGTHSISGFSLSGGKTGSKWDTSKASFQLVVNPVVPSDSTPPVITPNVVGTLGDNGWYVSDVHVSWTVTDNESAISSSSGCGPTTISSDTAGTTLICSATSAGGTNSQSVTIKRDATAPSASALASPAPNGNGWNNGDVTVSFTGDDGTGSGIASCSAAVVLSSEGTGQEASGTCTDNAGNTSAPATASGINIDKTAPSVSASASPAPNGNGWNNTNVTVSFSGTDVGGSGIDSCDAAVVLSSEGAGQSAAGSCTDKAGNSASATASGIKIDKTNPTATVTGVAHGAAYVLGSVPAAGCSTTDPVPGVGVMASGVDQTATASGYGTTIGSHTVTCSGHTDRAGNYGSSVSVTYSVIYNFAGFFRPVDNGGTLNVVKSGSAIPVKFSLTGYQGMNIFAAGYPKSQAINCSSTAATDVLTETVTAGGSSLSYDELFDQYNYVWKTDKSWAGQCRRLDVTFIDGTTQTALFKFNK